MSLLTGIKELIESPSGLFSLIALFLIAFVTLKQPSVGAGALAAFVGIVPAMLAYTESREQMQKNAAKPPPDIT